MGLVPRRTAMTAAAVIAAVTTALAGAPAALAGPPAPDGTVRDGPVRDGTARDGTARDGTARVRVEIPGPESGTAAGSGHIEVPRTAPADRARTGSRLPEAARAADGQVTKLIDNGVPADRLDIVVVGDGYTADQLERFHADARQKWAEIAAVEPYATYRELFNVWTVDAVSNESGVSGDPGADVVRDTALGSYFWCDGIERLLCVDQECTDAYVARAPEADLVLVLANSAKYGGAGYNEPSPTLGYEGISTASAGNAKSGQVALHETGHSLGKLADEYFYPDYPGYERYEGPEPADGNVSTLGADAMAAQGAKWHRWLGETSPDGGPVGTYEGGGYYVQGLNRPTDNSLMRSLGRPFNLPGLEAMIAGFHRHANLLTPRTPTDRILRPGSVAEVDVPRLAPADGRQATVRWYLDGKELERYAGRTRVRATELIPSLLDGRTHRLTVTAEDRTPSVRDPRIAAALSSSAGWYVRL
ncbi:M64 family metallopeptidase [Streptomyces sp. NPDC090022]|uniref:M64 family metallopeptidase n=1 Tax=Streptomyces sp. NPDC090022 TaxID=3365920 RepID=UPI00381F9BD7